jgi:16S rRNA (guanine527-N7)-methyltransferase
MSKEQEFDGLPGARGTPGDRGPVSVSEEQEFSDLLVRHFSSVEPLTATQIQELYAHYALLRRWNRVLNLTAIQKPEDVVVRHYCESLFLGAHLPSGMLSVVDVGSGGGFPGFPVAVLRPEARVTLVESHQRKAVFLMEATRGRRNVRVDARRAESLTERFDWVVSRAVRWDQVVKVATSRIALLLGSDDAKQAALAAGFHWNPPIPLPWGRQRVFLIGERASAN